MRSREWIEGELRQRIQRGAYPAGSRMPPHRTLQRELGASSVTLQRAFDRLGELGYVVARGSRGTFVAKELPHTSHIGVVFPDEIGKDRKSVVEGKGVEMDMGGGLQRRRKCCG